MEFQSPGLGWLLSEAASLMPASLAKIENPIWTQHACRQVNSRPHKQAGRKHRVWEQSPHGSPSEDNNLYLQVQCALGLFCSASQYRQMVGCQTGVRERTRLALSMQRKPASPLERSLASFQFPDKWAIKVTQLMA